MSGNRGRLLALVTMAAGAGLVLATATQPRWAVDGAARSVGARPPGGGGAPAATALALVALAGIGMLLLLRGPARSAVGLLVLVVGVAVVLVDVRVGKAATGWFAYAPLASRVSVAAHRSAWFWLTAAGGGLLALGGLLVAAYGRHWPAARRTYAARPEAARRRDPWTALDSGEDPTL